MNHRSLSLVPPADHPALTPARLGALLALLALAVGALGLAAGSEGLSWAWGEDAALIESIRAPRTLGALAAGALLGLAGALAQGLFRNPLADPFLLGSAAGAGLGVVLVLATGGALAARFDWQPLAWLSGSGVVLAAFVGALGGVALTLLLAGGAARPLKLLLCGVVVGVLMGALSDLLLMVSPEALRGKQMFLLGTTGFLGWPALGWLAGALALALPLALRFARVLDALVLGDASAASLGLPLPRLRLLLVGLMALATGTAVSQAGLVGFVGLIAPHLVRRLVTVTHGPLLLLSAAAGAVLLGAADVVARWVIAPQELPVGVLTAVFGGVFLLMLLRRQGRGT
jgi:iron complex transport system permease protein